MFADHVLEVRAHCARTGLAGFFLRTLSKGDIQDGCWDGNLQRNLMGDTPEKYFGGK
jgi:hypothetical protein